MAIKIINGQAVVVDDEQSGSNLNTSVPKPSSDGLFTKDDPGLSLDILKNLVNGIIPRATDFYDSTIAPLSQNKMPKPMYQGGILSAPWEGAKTGIKAGLDFTKMMAGIPVRAGLSLTDLFGGPKQANVPLIGPQESYQNIQRGLQSQGAGPVLSYGMAALQPIMDFLIGRHLKGKGGGVKPTEIPKPVETPVQATVPKPAGYYGEQALKLQPGQVTPQNLAMDLLESLKKPETPKPETRIPTEQEVALNALNKSRGEPLPWETPNTPQPVEVPVPEPVIPPTAPFKGEGKLSKLNPYTFEATRIEKMGPAGKELVMRGRRAEYTANKTTAELKSVFNNLKIDKLGLDEQLNLRQVLEGKATPINQPVIDLSTQIRGILNKYGKETQANIVENYFPRALNEAGRAHYNLPENKAALIDKLAQEGWSRVDATKVIENGLRKGGFEFQRVLENVPDEFRQSPLEELTKWASDTSRRKGVIEQFGKKDEIIKRLMEEVGRGNKDEGKMKAQAQEYVDRIAGRLDESSVYDPAIKFFNNAMVVSKIDPTTVLGNELQAGYGAYLKYGVSGLKDIILGEKGKQTVKDLGLDQLKGKFETDAGTVSVASRWMKAMGMEGSELRGKSRAVQAVNGAINRAFEALKKNPNDTGAKKLLQDHAMFIDEKSLAQALKEGKIPAQERGFGIADGVRRIMTAPMTGERPAWTNSGLGRASYTFKGYIMGTLQLLKQAPLHRQIAYTAVLAPLAGLPVLVIRRLIEGKDMPDNALDLYLSSATAGPGTVFDIMRSLGINPYGFVAGSLGQIPETITSKNKTKTVIKNNAPLQRFYINKLFPPK